MVTYTPSLGSPNNRISTHYYLILGPNQPQFLSRRFRQISASATIHTKRPWFLGSPSAVKLDLGIPSGKSTLGLFYRFLTVHSFRRLFSTKTSKPVVQPLGVLNGRTCLYKLYTPTKPLGLVSILLGLSVDKELFTQTPSLTTSSLVDTRIGVLKVEELYTKLKYSRSPAYDAVSGGLAALFAGLLGFLVMEKFGFELLDSGDFYYVFMYTVFIVFSLRPLLFMSSAKNDQTYRFRNRNDAKTPLKSFGYNTYQFLGTLDPTNLLNFYVLFLQTMFDTIFSKVLSQNYFTVNLYYTPHEYLAPKPYSRKFYDDSLTPDESNKVKCDHEAEKLKAAQKKIATLRENMRLKKS